MHQCSKAVDLIFLLDSSESVKYENWNQVTKFVKHLCDRFSLSLTRLAIIRYDSEAEIALPLTHFPDALSRDLAIDNIYYKTGGTRTDVALEKCIELIHSTEKRKASQVMILVTDGPSNKLEINRNNFVEGKDLVHAPSQLLKDEGVALFAIGIEPDSQTPKERNEMKEELQVIASEPSKSHVFLADGYRELERKVNDISNAACVGMFLFSCTNNYIVHLTILVIIILDNNILQMSVRIRVCKNLFVNNVWKIICFE